MPDTTETFVSALPPDLQALIQDDLAARAVLLAIQAKCAAMPHDAASRPITVETRGGGPLINRGIFLQSIDGFTWHLVRDNLGATVLILTPNEAL